MRQESVERFPIPTTDRSVVGIDQPFEVANRLPIAEFRGSEPSAVAANVASMPFAAEPFVGAVSIARPAIVATAATVSAHRRSRRWRRSPIAVENVADELLEAFAVALDVCDIAVRGERAVGDVASIQAFVLDFEVIDETQRHLG